MGGDVVAGKGRAPTMVQLSPYPGPDLSPCVWILYIL
jgi:hypothetical protein